MSVSRPQYQSYSGNKRQPLPQQPPKLGPMPPAQPPSGTQTPIYNNHEDVVRFVKDAWRRATSDPDTRVTYYHEEEPNPLLKDFKPVDLDAFCERRRAERSAQNSS